MRSSCCKLLRSIATSYIGVGYKGFASAPAVRVETAVADTVHLAKTAPVLVQLSERQWGASATLPLDTVPEAGSSGRIGVVRDAFTPFNAREYPLHTTIASLAEGQVAVHSAAAFEPQGIVVDEYVKDSARGVYRLTNIATDLLRLLRREGIKVCAVPDVTTAAKQNSVKAMQRGSRQCTNEVLMVAPTAFGFNDQTAQDNSFMHASREGGSTEAGSDVTQHVLREFSGLYRELTENAGVQVKLFQHTLEHGTPDAVFPNNWFSTHPASETGQESALVLYPMKTKNRAAERRGDIIACIKQRGYRQLFDMSSSEAANKYLEGTGALVPDRVNGVVYVNLSERADERLAQQWAHDLGYKDVVTFRTHDKRNKAVYHTNVMLCVGTDVAIVCAEGVTQDSDRQRLLASLGAHQTVVQISSDQMDALCGNVLELEDGKGLPILAMSSQAYNAFTNDQKKVMRKHVAAIHHAPIDTIEHVGGGGVRCSLAELF
ncbi:hypothetical protein ABBQ32_005868 [Trebouxia sp. C0010 RCD-2024]